MRLIPNGLSVCDGDRTMIVELLQPERVEEVVDFLDASVG
jgi:hypothetical protein